MTTLAARVNLLLFDVDGALVESRADDERNLLHMALQEALPADARPLTPEAWADLREFTEPAIVREVLTRVCNRPARDGEIITVRRHLIQKWEDAMNAQALQLEARRGAPAVLEAALRRPKLVVGIASASWGPPTLLKLLGAGYPVDQLVIASADDSEALASIYNTAGILAASERGVPGFSGTVIVGDGVDDVQAAGELRAGFVGIAATAEAGARLRAAGASVILPHLEPADEFWKAVSTALSRRQAATKN